MQLPFKSLSSTLFLDIETVSQASELSELNKEFKLLWRKKANFLRPKYIQTQATDEELYKSKAAIFSEFGKVICISVGYFQTEKGKLRSFKTKSFVNVDEKNLLSEFAEFLSEHYNNQKKHLLVGHNIREFDVPYICRRMLTHQIGLPGLLRLANKRPWQIKHIVDTMDLWRFGDYKHYVSLDLLAQIMAIPSPKTDISGDKVGEVFWMEQDIDRIMTYCENDVFTTALVYLKLNNINTVDTIKHKRWQLHKL